MKAGAERTALLAKDVEATREIERISYEFYWHTSQAVPKWLVLFAGIDGIEPKAMRGRGIQGLLVLERQGRYAHRRRQLRQVSTYDSTSAMASS